MTARGPKPHTATASMDFPNCPVDLRDAQADSAPWKIGQCLVEFWSFRCEGSRLVAPPVGELAVTQQGRLKVFKVEVDVCPKLTSLFKVTTVPFAILLDDGREIGHLRERWDTADALAIFANA